MNWAKELFEKEKIKFRPSISKRDNYIYVDDLVLAVLEKNKEIKKVLQKYKDEYFSIMRYTPITGTEKRRDKEQARAWRELKEECEKRTG